MGDNIIIKNIRHDIEERESILEYVEIPFGKYKGKDTRWVLENDKNYIEWLIRDYSDKKDSFYQHLLELTNTPEDLSYEYFYAYDEVKSLLWLDIQNEKPKAFKLLLQWIKDYLDCDDSIEIKIDETHNELVYCTKLSKNSSKAIFFEKRRLYDFFDMKEILIHVSTIKKPQDGVDVKWQTWVDNLVLQCRNQFEHEFNNRLEAESIGFSLAFTLLEMYEQFPWPR